MTNTIPDACAAKRAKLRLLAGTGALLALGGAANAQAADVAAAPTEAEILPQLTLVNSQGLHFGTLVVGSAGGAVIIDPATSLRSTVGDVVPNGGGPQRAVFTGTGPIGTVFVMAGDPNVTLTRASGTETMTANLVYQAGTGLSATLVFGLPIGQQMTATSHTINVGGTLIVNGSQAAGAYDGTFNLTLSYL
jgi:hypothetical protein